MDWVCGVARFPGTLGLSSEGSKELGRKGEDNWREERFQIGVISKCRQIKTLKN